MHAYIWKKRVICASGGGGRFHEYRADLNDREGTALAVGSPDNRSVDYVAIVTSCRGFRQKRQFHFQGNRPVFCRLGLAEGPWPENRPPMPAAYVAALVFLAESVLEPALGGSLLECVEVLRQPGPRYPQGEDGAISHSRQPVLLRRLLGRLLPSNGRAGVQAAAVLEAAPPEG